MAETTRTAPTPSQALAWLKKTFPLGPGRTPPGPPVVLGAVLAIWLFARANFLELVMGGLVAALVALVLTRARRDAEAAKREADALRDRLNDLEFALRMSSRAAWVVDFERREVRASQGLAEMLGTIPSFEDAANAAPSFVHAGDRAAVIAAHARALETGASAPAYVRFIRPNGVVRWVRFGMRALRDESGRTRRLSFVASDVTEIYARGRALDEMMATTERQFAASRPELERALLEIGVEIPASVLDVDALDGGSGQFDQADAMGKRFWRIVQEFGARRIAFHQAVSALKAARRSSDLFGQVASRSADPMLIVDENNAIDWANPAFEAISGYALDEVKGKTPGFVLSGPDTDHEALAAMRRDIEAGRNGQCIVVNYRKTGEPYWVDIRGARIAASAGHARTFYIQRDLTASKTLEASLERALAEARAADAAKTDFLTNVSHELRTPLNAVIGYAEILEEDLPAGGEQAADAQRIRAAAKHLLTLINEILDLAKLAEGAAPPAPCDTDFAALAREAADAAETLTRGRAVKVALTIEDDGLHGFTDAPRLRQCLMHVVAHVCRYTPEGDIRIDLARGDGAACFTIEDNGAPIAAADVARAFDPFVHADGAQRIGGPGMGLAVARRLAHSLGGDLTLESCGARGARFRLTAPLRLEGARMRGARAVALALDDAAERDNVARIVRALGFDVAADGDAGAGCALVIARADAAGLTALAARHPRTPVLALGAGAEGVTATLSDPVTQPMLVAAIARYAGGMRREAAPEKLRDAS